jgi:hypothetical protein
VRQLARTEDKKMKNKIIEISDEFVNSINEFKKQNENLIIKTFDIDCTELNYNSKDVHICDSRYFKKNFDELKTFEKYPTVYWFEFDTTFHSPEDLFHIFKNHKENISKRNLPAIYKNSRNTNILYLGKSKSCLWGRLLLHLGFHDDKHSQGLVLNEWSTNLNLKLTFNYCVFNENMSDLITLYELKLAQQTKPLIGKHR